jgi:hypothetical protein
MIKHLLHIVSDLIDKYSEEMLALTVALAGVQGLIIAYSTYIAYLARCK